MTAPISRPDDHTIIIASQKHTFVERIAQVLELGDRVVIRRVSSDSPYDDPECGRNVSAFGADGEIIWTIEDSGFTFKLPNGREIPQGYTHIREGDGVIFAFQPIGWVGTIDLETGRIIAEEQSK